MVYTYFTNGKAYGVKEDHAWLGKKKLGKTKENLYGWHRGDRKKEREGDIAFRKIAGNRSDWRKWIGVIPELPGIRCRKEK